MGRREFRRELHGAQGFAVAFRLGHAPVAENLLFRVAALLLADHHDGALFEPAHAGDHGVIVGEETVAVDFVEIGEQALDVIERMRALGVARQVHAIPTGITGPGSLGVSHFRQITTAPVASVSQNFHRFGSAEAGDFSAEFLVRPYFDGHIQDNREVAGFFEAQADFGVAGLARGTGSEGGGAIGGARPLTGTLIEISDG